MLANAFGVRVRRHLAVFAISAFQLFRMALSSSNFRVSVLKLVRYRNRLEIRMEKRCVVHLIFCAIWVHLTLNGDTAAAAERESLLTGKAAMSDWNTDAPGVRREITVQDLPAPSSNILSINSPRVVGRPENAQLQVPSGFKIDLYASGFRDPRFLLTAPNGDVFVSESRGNRIKVLRDAKRRR